MTTSKPIAFEITRHAREPERIRADSYQIEGNPPKYVFRKEGAVVEELFVHALEKEPRPIHPQTAEETAAWQESAQKHSAANESSYLEPE